MTISASVKGVAVRVAAAVAVAVAAAVCSMSSFAQDEAQAPASAQDQKVGLIILDTSSFWRVHYTMKPPVISKGDAVEEVKFPAPWIMHHTPLPPSAWENADFDDSAWARFPGVLSLTGQAYHVVEDTKPPFLALVCMRGRFEVTDPSSVKSLALSAAYRGGIVVYLNGKEIARGHLPRGGKGALEQLAEMGTDDRSLTDVKIPDGILRKGVNVLAVEVHRSAYREQDVYSSSENRPGEYVCIDKGSCGILSIRLTAPSGEGVVANIARPKGLQVWNSSPVQLDCDMDYGDPNEALGPIRIVGTRNGAFSGKVVVGSDKPIKGLRAVMSDLRSGEGGTIPAAAAQVRYAMPADWPAGTVSRYLAATNCFAALEDSAPSEISVRTSQVSGRRNLQSPGVSPSFGATQPVWITVNVPRDAKAGDYEGTLAIRATDEEPVNVPVRLKVCDWTLPDPHDFVTWADLVQSPESVALQYDVPVWSAEHFRYLEKSLRLLGQVGDKATYIHLICRSNAGNAQTMVRWIKEGEGKYTYDFSPMDRYLDLVEKHAGKPAVVCLYVWDTYCSVRETMEGRGVRASTGEVGVSGLDAEGKVSEIKLPPYGSPGSKEMWKPLMDGIRDRLQRRGLDKAIMLGISTDTQPTKEVVEFFNEVSPGTPWVSQAHAPSRGGYNLYGARFGYSAMVFSSLFAGNGDPKYAYGWRRPDLVVHYPRATEENSHLLYFRMMGELNIAGYHRGFARVGADFWDVLRNKRGTSSMSIAARYPETTWANLNIRAWVLAPGKDGAVSTHQFEMLREGLQECEARIFIERALLDNKIDGELAERCRRLLDDRIPHIRMATSTFMCSGKGWYYTLHNHCWQSLRSDTAPTGYYWYVGSDWQQRSSAVYSAAAEVARALGKP